MTNEELTVRIQAGEQELMPELWMQVERFAAKLSNRWSRALDGVEFDDLYQSGYLALVAAVNSYDSTRGMQFIGWYALHLKTAFLEASGRRSVRQQKDPIHQATSLDLPLGDDEDGGTLGDLVSDPDSIQGFEEAEQGLWRAQLRAALDRALEAIPEAERNTLRRRYFQKQTLEGIASVEGVNKEAIRQRAHKGLRALRRPRISRELQGFIEEQTPYYCHVGVKRFNTAGTSAVEEAVLRRESLTSRYSSATCCTTIGG